MGRRLGMLIRLATTEDASAIAALVRRYWVFESIGGFDLRRVRTLLRAVLSQPDLGACWVAEADGRLCGYLLAVFMFSLEHGGLMAEIDELFVSSAKRRAGVGSRLVTAAARDLGRRGLVRLQLELGVDNKRALQFYRRHGFRRRAGFQLLDKALRKPPSRRSPPGRGGGI
jgi:ribosomal protein S18 acetylase RimI-like enzyme